MGQKINAVGFRIGVNHGWEANWFASKKDYATFLGEDIKIRKYLEPQLKEAMPYSKMKDDIAKILKDQGYIIDATTEGEGAEKSLNLTLKYGPSGEHVGAFDYRVVHLGGRGESHVAQHLQLQRDLLDAVVQRNPLEDGLGLAHLLGSHHRVYLLLCGDGNRS